MAPKKKAAPKKAAEKVSAQAKGELEVAEAEREKEAGQTPEQKKYTDYHKGDFQKIDPVTGEKRKNPLPE